MSVQTLYSAATGMSAMETKLDVIANNLANIGTTAFKRGRPNFEDLFYRQEEVPGAQDSSGQYTATGTAIGLGSRVSSVQTELRQGAFQQTERELDVAIEGRGFFQVLDPTGEVLYTRAGNFSVNADGQLVLGSAATGRLLEPSIVIPEDATAISISPEGVVSVRPLEAGREPVRRERRLGRADNRDSRPGGARATAPRVAGGLQRRAGPGTDRSDYHPAGLRAQLAGHSGGRRNHAVGCQPEEAVG
jgi:flagellar basal body rod protein FlgG